LNNLFQRTRAEGQYDRLPALAADLIQQKVTAIAPTSTPAALAATAATSTVPIVFTTGGDPIKLGLVASLNRPGGNVTGVTGLSVEVGPKRLELAREPFPGATTFALLVNPANPLAATVSKDLQAVADTLGVRLHVLHASTEADFEAAFATAAQLRVAALVISTPIRCSTATPRSSAHSPSATAFQRSSSFGSLPPPVV
jgi:putative tryptophan/tyrosine transport system substrate-binding protein